VLSAALLVAASLLALRHSPSTKKVVVLPQATTTVTCGQVITVSITVGNDLNCPSTDGLVVGAKSITINLNGHTLTGNGGTAFGVFNNQFSGVTIENGSVQNWFVGLSAGGGLNKITGVRAFQNSTGLSVFGSGSTASGNVSFSNATNGMNLTGINNKATSNVVRSNGGNGIRVFGTGDVVQTNQVENNGASGISDGGTATTITGNVTNANGGDGILVSGFGIPTVGTNTANFNGAFGIEASPGGKDSGGNLAKGNTQATQCKNVICS